VKSFLSMAFVCLSVLPLHANTVTVVLDTGLLPYNGNGPNGNWPEPPGYMPPDEFGRTYTFVFNDEIGQWRCWKYDCESNGPAVFEISRRAGAPDSPNVVSVNGGIRNEQTMYTWSFVFDRAYNLLDFYVATPQVSDSWDVLTPSSSLIYLRYEIADYHVEPRYAGAGPSVNVTVAPIPLPASGLALGLPLLGLFACRRKGA
jgi:hypothetical protein